MTRGTRTPVEPRSEHASNEDWQGVFLAAPVGGIGGRGYHSAVFPPGVDPLLWIEVDLGESTRFDRIVLHPAHYREQDRPQAGGNGHGFGFPVRFRIDCCDDPDNETRACLFEAAKAVSHPGLEPWVLNVTSVAARYVRLTVTEPYRLANGTALLALDEIQVMQGERNCALHRPVRVANALASPVPAGAYDWHPDCLTDGLIHIDPPQREDQGDGNLFRRVWHVPRSVTQARAHIAARGYYELRIDGDKVGDAVLDPPFTLSTKRLLYSTWDVTKLLTPGDHVVTVLLGHGLPMDPAFILQINADHDDGTRSTLVSDGSWTRHPSPLIANHIYHGEVYDACREDASLFRPDGRTGGRPATPIAYRPVLSAQMNPPIRVTETIRPVAMTEPRPGVFVFDLGRNITGWARIRVCAERGTRLRLRFAETVFDDGSTWTDACQTQDRKAGRLDVVDGMINNANYRTARATDVYICGGDGEEVWEPRFTYHGFRFVELTGYPGTPTLDTVAGRVVHSDLPPRLEFSCSDAVINWTQEALQRTLRQTIHGMPTDCPQRDERQGWMGDAQVNAEATLFNLDSASLFVKWLRDMRDAQRDDGAVFDTTPPTIGGYGNDAAWSGAIVLVAWDVYVHTGDCKLLEAHFPAMRRFVDYYVRRYPVLVVEDSEYGDWLSVEETPGALIGTGMLCRCARIVAQCASVLGAADDAQHYADIATRVGEAFNDRFFDASAQRYGTGSQFSQALPLFLDLVPREHRNAVERRLVENIEERGGHLSTGIQGTKILLGVLCEAGCPELAVRVAGNPDYPGWGFMRRHGATTIWEHWEHLTGDGMNGHSHSALTSVGAWFVRYLAGIRPDPEAPGFRHIVFQPELTCGLSHVRACLETPRGTVRSAWQRRNGRYRINLSIPPGASGTLLLRNAETVHKADRLVWAEGRAAEHTRSGRMAIGPHEPRGVRMDLESGTYNVAVEPGAPQTRE